MHGGISCANFGCGSPDQWQRLAMCQRGGTWVAHDYATAEAGSVNVQVRAAAEKSSAAGKAGREFNGILETVKRFLRWLRFEKRVESRRCPQPHKSNPRVSSG